MSTRVTSARARPANDSSASAKKPARRCHMRWIVDQNKKSGTGHSADPARTPSETVLLLVNDHPVVAVPDRVRLPVLVENGPERLIEILTVLQKRLAQQSFLHGADFSQRAVAASVAYGRPSFQPMHANSFER